jgi:hypothetical protein
VKPAQNETEIGTALSQRHTAAIALLAEGKTIDEVARELAIGRTTLYRWRTTPLFAAALAQATAYGLEAAQERLRCLRENALDVLERLLTDAQTPAAVQLAAAREVMDRTGLDARTEQRAEDDRPVTPEEEAEAMQHALRLVEGAKGKKP